MKTLQYTILAMLSLSIVACSDSDDANEPQPATPTAAIFNVLTDALLIAENEIAQIEAEGDDLSFESDNEKVAIVTSDGLVKGIACGVTEITVSNGTEQQSIAVKVTPQKYDGYTLVWNDEFNGSSLDQSSWNIETGGGGWGNQEKQYYTDRTENLSVSNGNLIITVRKEEYSGSSYTSGRVTTKNKHDFTYGRIEARIKLPKGGGTWPAFWMLGYGSWPRCGEIDIMEHMGNQPNIVSFALHTTSVNGTAGNNWSSTPQIANVENDYHIFGVEWTDKYEISTGIYRQAIIFMVDGEALATKIQEEATENVKTWPFFNPFYIILNCAIGGTMGGSIDNNIFTNQESQPVQMLVDWVRVYQAV